MVGDIFVVFIFKDGREIHGFDIELLNIVGALSYLSNVIKKLCLNITYLETCGVSNETYSLFIALDFTDSEAAVEDFMNEIDKDEKYIKKISLAPSIYNLIFSGLFCYKDIGGVRVIYLSTASMRGLIGGIKNKFGKEAGNALLYHIGNSVGGEIFNSYASRLGISKFDDGVALLDALFKAMGWGKIAYYEKYGDIITAGINNLWECEIRKEPEEPGDHFTRGVLNGFFKLMLDAGLGVKQTKCMSRGDDACEFEMTIKSIQQ